LLITNGQSITNASIWLKNNSSILTIELSFLILAVLRSSPTFLVRSSYGRAYKAIREDEIRQLVLLVYIYLNLKCKLSCIQDFMAGVGGAMLASVLGTIDPNQFTFHFSIYVVVNGDLLGGQGSLSGAS